MEEMFSTSLCEAEFARVGLKFWIGDDDEPLKLDIHTAASVGDIEYINSLPKSTYDMYNYARWTPLMYSCYLGHRRLLIFLLEQGCDICKSNIEGRTPLMLAGMCGNLEMVKDILIWRNERVEVRDKTDKRNFSALSHAVHGGHIDVVEYLLEQGASPNITEHEKGYSLVMMAAVSGNYDITEILLEHKADLGYENAIGDTALSVALAYGHSNIARLIRKHLSGRGTRSVLDGPARADQLMQEKLLLRTGNSSHILQLGAASDLLYAQQQIDGETTQMNTDVFLKNLGLEKYSQIFREQEVDFQLLLNLNNNDFLFKGARRRFPVNSEFKKQ
ncbi:ankyrin repeat and SAM domain-containing protein 3 isoform X2 [Eurytemora carolleeae]|uniref:ankyrin repeat and SAM domain-containing protein 3 isoform X2 n=1 Tax=Eurytemora carolleeae TaxID=1294199 RepID=UPI000C78FBC3|nr:ankyrin repeat and SAM domain-containing protein 3 isoform X2 [Eurytemora carolleeae]|eukprot:XP_023335764.1 ankyrin repeat and SAM domain-containing protein 3-like isoform X2 [Eurytemora affinis]